jgi:hypothetical protein
MAPEDHHAGRDGERLDRHAQLVAHHLAVRAVTAHRRQALRRGSPRASRSTPRSSRSGDAQAARDRILRDRHLGPGRVAVEHRRQRDGPLLVDRAGHGLQHLAVRRDLVHEDPHRAAAHQPDVGGLLIADPVGGRRAAAPPASTSCASPDQRALDAARR